MKPLMAIATAMLLQGTVVAQDLWIYPAKNQSKQQMEKDKFECQSWARRQTNFDPTAIPQQAAAQPQSKQSVGGGVAKGILRGGALGLGIGAITGGTGKRVGTSAVVGGALVNKVVFEREITGSLQSAIGTSH
jgi:hypothetical protein